MTFRDIFRPPADNSRGEARLNFGRPADNSRGEARLNFGRPAKPSSWRGSPNFRRLALLTAALLLPALGGCGYTQQAALPRDIKTIYVRTVINKIPVEEIVAYHPGLEMLITKEVIRRFNRDGVVRVVSEDEADAVLEMDLIRFEQEGLRFSSLERVEEFRLFIVLSLRLVHAATGEIIWQEPKFSGDAEYFVSSVRSLAREEAVGRAVDSLARRVVDRVVEDW